MSWYAAAAWRDEDIEAAEVADEITAELRSRYDIDVETLYDTETAGLDGESYRAWLQADAAAMNKSTRTGTGLESAVGDIDPRAQAVAEALRRSFPRPIRQEAAEWVARHGTTERIDRHQRVGRRSGRPRSDVGR